LPIIGDRKAHAYAAPVSTHTRSTACQTTQTISGRPTAVFGKGNPGGPGRPPLRERAAALDALATDAGAELIEIALNEAKTGNLRAVEMLLDRIWPVRRGRRSRSMRRRSARSPIWCRRERR
jgi:hypothetical protein